MNPINSVIWCRFSLLFKFVIFVSLLPCMVSGSISVSSFFNTFTSSTRFGYVQPSEGVLSVFPGRVLSTPAEEFCVFSAPVKESSIPFFSDRGLTLHGYIVSGAREADNACEVYLVPPNPSSMSSYVNNSDNFILLVASSAPNSSDCSSTLQALHAQEAGYQALIIYNVESNTTDGMDMNGPSSSVQIPVYFIGEYDGQTIRDWYTLNRHFFITIEIPSPILAIFIFYGIWFGLLVIVIAAFWHYMRPCIAYFIHPWCVRVARRRKRAALARTLIQLPIVVYKIGSQTFSRHQQCIICMEDYTDGEHLRVLYCSHGFHKDCIDKWFVHRARCPVCKATLRYSNNSGHCSKRVCGVLCKCVSESEWSGDEEDVDLYNIDSGLDPACQMAASDATSVSTTAAIPTVSGGCS